MSNNPYNTGDFPTGIFYPYLCQIESISQGTVTTVTTAIDHAFVIGGEVTFVVPQAYGMRQISGLTGYILFIPAPDQIVVNIDSTYFNPFILPVVPPTWVLDPALVIPVGDQNTGTVSPGGQTPYPNQPPGSFNVTIL